MEEQSPMADGKVSLQIIAYTDFAFTFGEEIASQFYVLPGEIKCELFAGQRQYILFSYQYFNTGSKN